MEPGTIFLISVGVILIIVIGIICLQDNDYIESIIETNRKRKERKLNKQLGFEYCLPIKEKIRELESAVRSIEYRELESKKRRYKK